MCGIAGLLTDGPPAPEAVLRNMRDALAHRGPDGEGQWTGGPAGMVHTRLAIIDPSPAANQPMATPDGRHVICFNGEIYNYRELRAELGARGVAFTTASDTEVLLAGFARMGTGIFARLEGMFAAALWDGRRLVLVRDRFGMKPLFHARTPAGLAFASEPKALLAAGLDPQVRPQGLLEYVLLNATQGDGCIFAGVDQVEPGTWLAFHRDGSRQAGAFWSLPTPPRPAHVAWPAVAETLRATFSAAVRRHLVSDVPVGIYLSGGIDSALVAAAAAREGARLHSFSLGFADVGDRAYLRFAERLALRLGMRHRTLALAPGEAPKLLGEMANFADEPLGDAADLAVYALSRAARGAVKVVLTGDGGDEVFGGYVRHRAELLARRGGKAWRILRVVAPFLGEVNRRRVQLLQHARPAERYAAYLTNLTRPAEDAAALLHPDLLAAADFEPVIEFVARQLERAPGLSGILATDLRTILPDSYLRKTDRACMMAGIEGRLPYLDRSLVELAFALPERALVTLRRGKIALRRLLAEWIPDYMTAAPKMGFTVPLESWLREPGIAELRHDLAGPAGALGALVSRGARDLLAGEPRDPQRAATQWKLLRLGLWAERWLRTSPGPGEARR